MSESRVPWERRPDGLDLLVLGHINLDHFLDVEALPAADRTVPITRQVTELGGTATNIARSAAAWGVRTGIVSRVGDDFPSEYWRQIEAERIDLSAVERVRGVASSCCYIVEDRRGGQMTLIHQGPMGKAKTARVPLARLKSTGWLHLATGDPEYQLRVLKSARQLGVRVSVDPAQEIHYRWDARRFRQLVSGAEILFGNTSEIDHAAALLGAKGRVGLLEFVPMVVETRGRRGATA
ncbi:MAG: PfkB family carbohydrate kinase, partial [Thermoplasmata archaeon]|nr:PfkB family carbohydrate kinase [Thermoplasmata archaeon]